MPRLSRSTCDTKNVLPGAGYFPLAVLGFSFWFFVAVPFASHRETYWWLAEVRTGGFLDSLAFISSTYRPLHQALTWLSFEALDPAVFPTRADRQAVFQVLVYAAFVLAWWLVYSGVRNRRVFSLVSCVAGGAFFSGYVHLFHVYGTAYVPVMLVVGLLLSRANEMGITRHEKWLLAAVALLLLWHPFSAALLVAFHFGHYLDTWHLRSTVQRWTGAAIAVSAGALVFAFLFVLPFLLPDSSALLVETASRSLVNRWSAWLVSYQTSEVNRLAAGVALALAELTVFSLPWTRRARLVTAILVGVAAALLSIAGLPLLLLWIFLAQLKLFLLGSRAVLFLSLTAALLPLGAGIGSPIHALFALVIGVYAVALGSNTAEDRLSRFTSKQALALAGLAMAVVIPVRSGTDLPVMTGLARPLLAERERTYQLEQMLAWLRDSPYCGRSLEFTESAGNPVDSVSSAIVRRHRPPASSEDVLHFWNRVLRCADGPDSESRPLLLTFGDVAPASMRPLLAVPGRHAGAATIWDAVSPAADARVGVSANSCSALDVAAAIARAQDGDVITIPNGSCRWPFGIETAKQISLRGASPGGVTITHAAGDETLLKMTVGPHHSTRIANLRFLPGSGSGAYVEFAGTGMPPLMHDVYFNVPDGQLQQAVRWFAKGGVLWRATFESTDPGGSQSGCLMVRNPGVRWEAASTMGTLDVDGTSNLYIEDSVFRNVGSCPDVDDNGRVVLRHSRIIGSSATTHGSTSAQGGRQVELYGNSYTYPDRTRNINRYFWFRGGTAVITGNRVEKIEGPMWGSKLSFSFTIENTQRRTHAGCCVTYMCWHQPGAGGNGSSQVPDPVFIWNNTGSGASSIGTSGADRETCGSRHSTDDFFKPDRDYFVERGPKPGYVPYRYPHPLRQEAVLNRPAPRNGDGNGRTDGGNARLPKRRAAAATRGAGGARAA